MPKLLLKAGFDKAVLKEFDVGFDACNLRITFPVRNASQDLVAIYGRTVIDEEPKYILYSGNDFYFS